MTRFLPVNSYCIIGATTYYATANLEAVAIIEQDVVRVSHCDEIDDFVTKGKDLDRVTTKAQRTQKEERNA